MAKKTRAASKPPSKPPNLMAALAKAFTSVKYASCYIYNSHADSRCPMCGVLVPAGVEHQCEKKS